MNSAGGEQKKRKIAKSSRKQEPNLVFKSIETFIQEE